MPRRAAPVRLIFLAAACAAIGVGARTWGDGERSARGEQRQSRVQGVGAAAVAAPAPTGDSTRVRFAIDERARFAISPFIYGVNWYGSPPGEKRPPWPRGLRLSRSGGNRLTAYNWENNASNAGADWHFNNDGLMGGGSTVPGEAVRAIVEGARARGAGIIVTVPMIGHVARDANGTSVGTDAATLATRLATRFVRSHARKGGPLAPSPNTADDAVYQDEFVAWLARKFPTAVTPRDSAPIFFSLDNEPDIWGSTHEELMPKVDGKPAVLTYDELIARSAEYAREIKRVAPGSLVFGPAVATWAGAATLGRYPTPDPRHGTAFFLDVYLAGMRAAEQAAGSRLLDVLDLHWYPEVRVSGARITDDHATQTPAVVEARLQAPRSLWDPTYDEKSWVSEVQGGPVRLLPLLREKIAAHYPGTRIAITEYGYGRGGDISGGVAQADVLGIFGREGVHAATLWPLGDPGAPGYGGSEERAFRYVIGAFRMYRDYDGKGSAFGPVGLGAATSDPVGSSVYASTDSASSAGAGRVVVVAINKRSVAQSASLEFKAPTAWRRAAVYTLTEAAAGPKRAPDLAVGGAPLNYIMPPLSVSTIVLER